MSKFQLFILIFFGVFIFIGVAAFATYKGSSTMAPATIKVWGVIPSDVFNSLVANSSLNQQKNLTIVYTQKQLNTFDTEFVNALADGTGPDVVMISTDMLWQHKNRLLLIPFSSYSERAFKDTFISEGELFLTREGMYALPFSIDPLVMYWNRRIFNNASISKPPVYWDELLTLAPQLTRKDNTGVISQSLISLGEWKNVRNAKAILSTLMLQAGLPITAQYGIDMKSTLKASVGDSSISPGFAALNFYTQFANPTGVAYSWNRSLPDSLTYFVSGKQALYVGFASELQNIALKNPNLDFDVALLPQARQVQDKAVFGRLYGLAITKQSKVVPASFAVITALTESQPMSLLTTYTNLPPVRRDLLSKKPTDAYLSVFYDSALVSKGWIDPNQNQTNTIFQNMIESVTSGKYSISDALSRASDDLDALFVNQQ